MATLVVKLDDQKSLLINDWKTHLTHENIPRKYAKTELAEFYEKATRDVQILVQEIESSKERLTVTLKNIKSTSKMGSASAMSSKLKRKQKENEHHALKRKEQRLEIRAARIAKNLGRVKAFGSISPTIT